MLCGTNGSDFDGNCFRPITLLILLLSENAKWSVMKLDITPVASPSWMQLASYANS